MSNNILRISKANPVHFVELNPADAPKFRSKRIDSYRFAETIFKWNNQTVYRQKWQKTETKK